MIGGKVSARSGGFGTSIGIFGGAAGGGGCRTGTGLLTCAVPMSFALGGGRG
jgi:hypothetical protein